MQITVKVATFLLLSLVLTESFQKSESQALSKKKKISRTQMERAIMKKELKRKKISTLRLNNLTK